MRTRLVPRDARRLRAYAEFESYLVQFVANYYPFLWIVGRPGISKSESITNATRGKSIYYRKGGQLTPLQLYLDLFQHRGDPIILDDAEHLLNKPLGAKLLTALGDTSRIKHLSYGSTSRAMGDTPQSFTTTSSLCIVANKGTTHQAIQSRAITLHFDPTDGEIHRAVAKWFWEQEIHDWFGEHLSRLRPIDMRWYLHAENDKRGGRDWQGLVLRAQGINRAATIVQNLELDSSCPTREDKARRFAEMTGGEKGGSRATYHRILKRLLAEDRLTAEVIPPIPLRHRRRPDVPTGEELDSLTAPVTTPPEVISVPMDLPLREQFAQPIRGTTPPQSTPPRPSLDDSVPWEIQPETDEGDDED